MALTSPALPPPDLSGTMANPGHGSAFTLLFVYLGLAGIGGVVLGNLLVARWLRGRSEPLTGSRQIIVTALAIAACALAIFAVLSFATMLVMKFM